MTLRICAEPGCPRLVNTGRCADHRREREQARGSRQDRGYDAGHDRLRREWAPKVATGNVRCARCGELIRRGQAWDLGHDDHDRSKYNGPEHAGPCNRAAGGRAAHG